MTCPASVDKVKLNTVYQNRRRYLIYSQELDKRISFLREIAARKKQELQCKPQGTLVVNSCRGKPQYYLRENGKRTYLRENQQQMVRKLCQKSYDQKILAAAGEELEELEKPHCSAISNLLREVVRSKLMASSTRLMVIYFQGETPLNFLKREEK